MKSRILLILIFSAFPLIFAGTAGDIIMAASDLVGTPYRYGGASPSGFDCSGLLYYLYGGLIPSFPRTSSSQAGAGQFVSREDLQPGDLVFYATGFNRNKITHAALYIGDNALIQAVSEGPQTGVVITDMDERYWKNRYVTSRRVLRREKKSDESNDFSETSDTVVIAEEEELPPVAKEKVIDSKGQEKTVVSIGTRRFTLISWEEWFAQEQKAFGDKQEEESRVLDEDLSDFEKWKKQNSPG